LIFEIYKAAAIWILNLKSCCNLDLKSKKLLQSGS